MDSTSGFAAVVAAVRNNARSVGIFSDFDGTLSHIIADRDAVMPIESAVETLTELAHVCGRTAVVSGRPVSFLEQFFAAPVQLSGLYGIEHRADDTLTIDPAAAEWMPVISAVAADAKDRFGDAAVEDKTYSLTVHYRGASEKLAAEIETWSVEVAEEHGLHARSAKMSVEIHPPLSRDKGDAVAGMLTGLSAAIFFGDDVGDRSAFDRLASAGGDGALQAFASVLVKGAETPDELSEAVTDVVSTPEEAVAMLEMLLHAAN